MTKESDGKSIAQSILGTEPKSDHEELTEALRADSIPLLTHATINGESIFHFMEPADFERIFRGADKDFSNSLTKDELIEFQSQAEAKPQLDRATQVIINHYDEATRLVKNTHGILDDTFSAKHYGRDPIVGILSRQDFDMLKMITNGNTSNEYSSDNFQSEQQRNSRACFMFAGTAFAAANGLLSRRTPILAMASVGLGIITAALGSAYLFNDHPTLREYKQRKSMIESWQLQVPLK